MFFRASFLNMEGFVGINKKFRLINYFKRKKLSNFSNCSKNFLVGVLHLLGKLKKDNYLVKINQNK